MSKDNGTPLCTNGQLATVASRIIIALPKALEHSGLDIKSIISHTGEGERLSLAISEAFKMLYNGHAATAPTSREGSRGASKVKNSFLRLISSGATLAIAPCDGTLALAQARETFLSGIARDFKNWGLDNTGEATEETAVRVYEVVKEATFAQMYGSLGDDLDKLCLTPHQIVAFCAQYPDWLRIGGYATFFLFKVKDRPFVARVYLNASGLDGGVDHFDRNVVWPAKDRNRLVTPQLGAM